MAKVNSVPQGVAGTGAAYILPQSRALNGLLDNIEYNRKMGLLNIKARADAGTQMNKDFADNQLKAKSGILYQGELNHATQKWLEKGTQYRTQGFNPFSPNVNDPAQVKASDEYLREKAQIEGMAQTRDDYQKNFLDQQGAYEKGGYDEDSWTALNDFYSKNSLNDLYNGGIQPPTLTKSFDTAEFMKGIQAPTIKSNRIKNNVETTVVAPNEGAIRLGVEGALKQNPQAERFFNKQFGIDPSAAPAKTLLGTVDPTEVDTYIDQYYKTTPEGTAAALKAFPKGAVPSYNSPEYAQFKKDAVAKQLQLESRYENGIQGLVKQKAAEVNQQNIKNYNFDLNKEARAAEDQGMARTRFGWDETNQGFKFEDRKLKNADANKRDQFIQGLQVGNTEEMMNLRQLIKSKSSDGAVSFHPDGRLKIEWSTLSGGQKVKHTKDIDLSSNNQGAYVELNEVLNDVAGKKIPIETLQSKPTYEGGLVNIGDVSLKKDQITYLRDKFGTDYKSLGDMLKSQGKFKTYKEAYKAALEILDTKGRVGKVTKQTNE